MDLSVLIAARNEMFLADTVKDVLAHSRADTEVIVICDGAWPDPPLDDQPRVTVVYLPTSIGQRASVNLAARMSKATYVMKLDAHCSVGDGFDAALIAADRELDRDDITQIPSQYNLHAFNWRCRACGRETYQGPTPTACQRKKLPDGQDAPGELDVDVEPCGRSEGFDRVMVWQPRKRRAAGNGSDGRGHYVQSDFWRFDHELHFQYWHAYKDRPAAKGDLADVMSNLGACFFMRRARFDAIGGLDEATGSWGQFGTEIACKSWLSGGRHIVNKRTTFGHMFRTQGGDFGFPYPNPAAAVDKARARSRDLWLNGTWPKAIYPLSWLIEKFAPVPDWTPERVSALPKLPSRYMGGPVTKGVLYYSDNRGIPEVLRAARNQIVTASRLPITAVTLEGLDVGWPDDAAVNELCLELDRGKLTMFKQILAGLLAMDTDIVFHCEHDVLYHPSHFEFTPPDRDKFYYNQHTWRVDAVTGRALFYRCSQVSGLCAYRETLIDHYRKRVEHVTEHGFDRNLGYEPGTNRHSRALDSRGSDVWMSEKPNVDIKTEFCLTPGRWSQSQFRSKASCQEWTEAERVPGWGGKTFGRFAEWLRDVDPLRAMESV